ncbi:MAG: acyl-CoA reductase [Chitinophagales bacterium]
MQLTARIDILVQLGKHLREKPASLHRVVVKACLENPWFTKEHIYDAIEAICEEFLDEKKLLAWLARYDFRDIAAPTKTVGIVMAGNIPLVGFHDFLCVFVSGQKSLVKLSSKDKQLFKYIAKTLFETSPEIVSYIEMPPFFKNFDAVIATGSNNSSRYFDYYFGKYPHIIRKSRSSVALLNGKETAEDIKNLGIDIFKYLGLGCRNVSKLYVPKDFDFVYFLDNLQSYSDVQHHNKYKNNYDYYRSIYLLNREHHYASNFVMLVEKEAIASPISTLYYEFYENEDDLSNKIIEKRNEIQCIVATSSIQGEFIAFGEAQKPQLWEYADNKDTLQFLIDLEA